MSITVRRIALFAGLLILFGAFAAARFMSQQKEAPRRQVTSIPVKGIDTLHVKLGTVPMGISIQGELSAFDKIELFSEVTGTLKASALPFKVGTYFPKGSVLIEIDQEEARLALLAQRSNLLNAITQLMPDLKTDQPESFAHWKAYLDRFDIEAAQTPPMPEPLNNQEKYFIAARNLHNQYFSIKSAEERLGKHVLRAPFGGVLTEASINPGAVVRMGQKLGALMGTDYYELEATLPLRDLKYVKVGNSVVLHSDDMDGQWQGRIKRISDQVEPGTQTVKLFIGVSGKGLRENMYLRGEVAGSPVAEAFELPRQLLVEQKSVYVFQDSLLRLQEVEVVRIKENTAIIRGLSAGTPLLAQPFADAFDGRAVFINQTSSKGKAQSAESADEASLGQLK